MLQRNSDWLASSHLSSYFYIPIPQNLESPRYIHSIFYIPYFLLFKDFFHATFEEILVQIRWSGYLGPKGIKKEFFLRDRAFLKSQMIRILVTGSTEVFPEVEARWWSLTWKWSPYPSLWSRGISWKQSLKQAKFVLVCNWELEMNPRLA